VVLVLPHLNFQQSRTVSFIKAHKYIDVAVSKLHSFPDPAQAILLETGVLGKLQPVADDVLERLARVLTAEASRTSKFSLAQCSNIASTMTLLGFYNVPLFNALVQCALPELPTAPPPSIASLCYSLGLAGYSDHAFLKRLERVMEERSGQFEVKDFAKVVWMFGRAHYVNETVADFVQALAKRALAPEASAKV
jgi:hypothetical protein